MSAADVVALLFAALGLWLVWDQVVRPARAGRRADREEGPHARR